MVGGRVRLVLPATVDSVDGIWQSGADTAVAVEGNRTGLVVELTDGGG